MDGFQAGHLIAQDTIDLFNTGYSVYQDQRNYQFSKDVFDYNKALQQEIFNREDTAYERKRRDLERAGLNPNLAAGGSGSAAGQVVGMSNQAGDHQLYKADLMKNYGNFLAAQGAVIQNKNAEIQTEILEENARMQKNLNYNTEYWQARERFFDQVTELFDNSGSGAGDKFVMVTEFGNDEEGRPTEYYLCPIDKVRVSTKPGETFDLTNADFSNAGSTRWINGRFCSFNRLSNTRAWKDLEAGYSITQNDRLMSDANASMLGNEAEWQSSDRLFDKVLRIIDRVLNGGNVAANIFGKAKQRVRPQVKNIRKSWGRNFSNTSYDY